jgi:hypothetical protein
VPIAGDAFSESMVKFFNPPSKSGPTIVPLIRPKPRMNGLLPVSPALVQDTLVRFPVDVRVMVPVEVLLKSGKKS